MDNNKIFVNTNVLIGAWSGKRYDLECLKYLYSLNGKTIYTSALSIAQLVSVFQKNKDNNEVKNIVISIKSRFVIIGFTDKDIDDSLLITFGDMEDNIQYTISSKMHCFHLITNNIKDYRKYMNINILKPKEVRRINQ